MLPVFTRADGKFFIPPIILHQANEYSQDIHFNIKLDWTVHNTPSGYMDRDEWLKYMTQFSNLYSTSPVNNQIIFFNGNDGHFNEHVLRQMKCQKIQPFVIKSDNSTNNQTNYNGLNSKLKSLYNVAKAAGMLKYGTKRFLPHHMNSILMEVWYAFKVSSGNIIRDRLKKMYPPLALPN